MIRLASKGLARLSIMLVGASLGMITHSAAGTATMPRDLPSLLDAIVMAAACSAETMPSGAYGAYVIGVQEELPIHGYDAGPPNGILDARTRSAIRRYQRDAGLTSDGCVSQALLDHLKFHLPKVYAARKPPQATLAYAVQQELARRGYYLGAVDGKLGPRTRQAATRFQQDAGLPGTGIVDQGLLNTLKSADPAIRAR